LDGSTEISVRRAQANEFTSCERSQVAESNLFGIGSHDYEDRLQTSNYGKRDNEQTKENTPSTNVASGIQRNKRMT
jgi:hypothetical protein